MVHKTALSYAKSLAGRSVGLSGYRRVEVSGEWIRVPGGEGEILEIGGSDGVLKLLGYESDCTIWGVWDWERRDHSSVLGGFEGRVGIVKKDMFVDGDCCQVRRELLTVLDLLFYDRKCNNQTFE